MFFHQLVAGFNKGTDGGRRGVENANSVIFDNLPEAREVREIGCSLIHDLSHSIQHRSIGDVGVTSDPADVGGAPVDIVITHIEDVFAGGIGVDHITSCGVENALGLTR